MDADNRREGEVSPSRPGSADVLVGIRPASGSNPEATINHRACWKQAGEDNPRTRTQPLWSAQSGVKRSFRFGFLVPWNTQFGRFVRLWYDHIAILNRGGSVSREEAKKLRAYLYSLQKQQEIAKKATETPYKELEVSTVELLKAEVDRIDADFPGMVPEFDEMRYRRDFDGIHPCYYAEPIWSYLGMATSQLESALDDFSDMPVIEEREFLFVEDTDLRRILERDYREIQRVNRVEGWKSMIILAGGAIEAILTDLLLANETTARSATAAPSEADIREWRFFDLIKVAVEVDLINIGCEKFSHSIRQYRNLVHPGKEIREHLKVEKEEATIALEVLNLVHRELLARRRTRTPRDA